LDSAGKPAREVEVSVSGRGHARVDERGRFRIRDVPPGEQGVCVARPDGYPLLETKVAVAPGADVRDLVLRIPDFGKVEVRVVDPEGNPLRGVEVYAYGGHDCDWRITGEDGCAVLDQIKEEIVDVSAEMNAGNRAIRLQAYVEKVRPAGQEITLVLEAGVPITGVVLGVDGRPASGLSVWATCEGREDDWFHGSTGEKGEFHVLVKEGRYFDLMSQRADDDGKVVEKGTVRQVAGPKEGVEIRLEPAKE
ncbi:MAG: carboxypeptidase-like regulatory domain-containing protein, partial [Planctomycetes bacterium]|nr:carboxypeptidase-like regulatory domain-containing protein [Planctomycetota bacterium]